MFYGDGVGADKPQKELKAPSVGDHFFQPRVGKPIQILQEHARDDHDQLSPHRGMYTVSFPDFPLLIGHGLPCRSYDVDELVADSLMTSVAGCKCLTVSLFKRTETFLVDGLLNHG